MAIKVSFQGTPYWLLAPSDGDFGALAPLHHCDAEGAPMYLYEDGNISREGEIVGAREDLKAL